LSEVKDGLIELADLDIVLFPDVDDLKLVLVLEFLLIFVLLLESLLQLNVESIIWFRLAHSGFGLRLVLQLHDVVLSFFQVRQHFSIFLLQHDNFLLQSVDLCLFANYQLLSIML
jgi:hypothetical protein